MDPSVILFLLLFLFEQAEFYLFKASNCLDDLVQQSRDLFVEGEGQGDIENDSSQSGDGTLVETSDTFILEDLDEAIKTVLVFLGIETLHLSLDDIDGSVG